MQFREFIANIEDDTLRNKNYRKIINTAKHSQLVLMSLKPGEDIGEEVHGDVDQFIRVEGGTGKFILNGKTHSLKDGSALVIPAKARHNIINTSKTEDLKLYSVYSPPQHPKGTVHRTKPDKD